VAAACRADDDWASGPWRPGDGANVPDPSPDRTLAAWLGWPNSAEVDAGRALLDLARGRCDLVLHGHRHVPSVRRPFPSSPRALAVVNSGSAPDLGRVRRYHHDGARLLAMDWIDLRVTVHPSGGNRTPRPPRLAPGQAHPPAPALAQSPRAAAA
jgi:hypothetical protein